MDNSRIISKILPAPFVLMSGSGLTCSANRCLIPALQGSGFAGLIQSRCFALFSTAAFSQDVSQCFISSSSAYTHFVKKTGCARLIKKDAESSPARKVSLIPRPCEALYPAGFFLNCQGSLFP